MLANVLAESRSVTISRVGGSLRLLRACSRLRAETRNDVCDCIVDTTRRPTEEATWMW